MCSEKFAIFVGLILDLPYNHGMVFARVVVNLPVVSGEFDYAIPPDLPVGPGQLVSVPFGAQTVQGVVFDLLDKPAVPHPKPILSVLDPQPVLTAVQMAFARQLAEATLNPLSAMVGLFLPAGLSQQADTLYTLLRTPSEPKGAIEKRLLDLLLERGPLRGRQIERHFGPVDWRKTAEALVRRGILSKQTVLPPPSVRPKYVRMAQLAVPPEVAQAEMEYLGKTEVTRSRRQAALRFLIQEPQAVALSWVYAQAGCTLADLQELEERGLIRLFESEIWRDPLSRLSHREAGLGNRDVALTAEQEAALAQIVQSLNLPSSNAGLNSVSTFLLHGITGSGKTELYLRAAAETIRQGRQAIILVPEIALTPQTVRRFLDRFPGQVGLVHSRLSDGERYDTWRRARAGLLKVVIGPRSALFTPLPKIGLIVVDECHDSSYYQSEPPFYSALHAAQLYGKLCGATTLLGSATPPVELRFHAVSALSPAPTPPGSLRLLELKERVTGAATSTPAGLPPVSIIDMRDELKAGNRAIFSRALTESMAEVLERGEQAILYLNRRGTATYVFCRDCGYVLKCPHCETPLTYHLTPFYTSAELVNNSSQKSTLPENRLICHHCSYSRKLPSLCPACAGKNIRTYGLGSEKVETEVKTLFPQARVLRWDWETTRERDAHEIILTHFANHQADILVGTQMLAKGLDLPLVTLVGIVLADVGLTLPDPFAGERVFQLLTQVAGRAGRSSRGGKVILQTFMPEHPVIQAAAQHDYAAFYQLEIETRRLLRYPPFSHLIRLEYRHTDPAKAESEARALAQRLKMHIEAERRLQTDLIGPAPCFFTKINDMHRWQIILRGPDPLSLLRNLPGLSDWRIEVEARSLL
ncbi:MAG: primosomal protein N' [Anaerolineae bacterium]|nr:MAG: primosomal protein N' [Anaerolineae bacterium]